MWLVQGSSWFIHMSGRSGSTQGALCFCSYGRIRGEHAPRQSMAEDVGQRDVDARQRDDDARDRERDAREHERDAR